eukprot:TRINITY_DN8312_c0_g2_i2.p1 TRINITY_DN8312_c0_g2~~TRINITY_DN8312_c0_g2_i2.p1  ORF type:complete len:840 (+),score=203.45 TRINITY_DN8312_c0_g2_i2:1686-4205(+)
MKELDVDSASSVRHLAERWISQASAEQRKGRAGRTGPGRCYRLYSNRLMGEMEAYMTPEIHRASLEGQVLQVLALGFHLHRFRFPEPPKLEPTAAAIQRLLLMKAAMQIDFPVEAFDAEHLDGAFVEDIRGEDASVRAGGWLAGFGVRGAEALLRGLGLLAPATQQPQMRLLLTPLGRVLSRLPVAVGVGKLLLLSLVLRVSHFAVILASAADLQSPRVQKHGERNEGRWTFDHHLGDLFTTLQVYQAWLHERSRKKGGSDQQSRKWAREGGVDETTLFELNKHNVQLCELLKEGAGHVQGGAGGGVGAKLRKDRMAKLEAAVAGGNKEGAGSSAGASDLSKQEREALQAELEELKEQESKRQRRRLAFEDGEGALVEDERGLGYSLEERDLGGWDEDGDAANASGGENNANRELNRRKPRPKSSKDRKKQVRLPKNDGLSARMRRRNIEFELRYGSHAHTARALEAVSARQEELLQLVTACAFYPNLALPHELNKSKTSADCVFHTRTVPFVNLHPGSAMYPELPTSLGPMDGFVYGSILQTYRPFLTHVTKCPVVPTVLLCSSCVDLTASCDMIICDEWLQLCFEHRDDLIAFLEEAQILRRATQRAMDQEIEELFETQCDDDVQEDLLEPILEGVGSRLTELKAPPRLIKAFSQPQMPGLKGKGLEDRMLAFWRRKVQFTWQPLTPSEYAAFQQAAGAKEKSRATAKPRDELSSGVTCGTGGWLKYGSISEEGANPESSLISNHLAIAWRCEHCEHTFRFNRGDIARHKAECVGELDGTRGLRQRADAGPPADRPASSAIGDRARISMWKCDQCDCELPHGATLEIFKHRRSHGAL